jgi:citrate synthase
MDPWKTAVARSDETGLWLRGHDVASLMKKQTFAEVLFLLNRGQLPTPAERRMLDAILIAVADHGPGSPSCAAARLVASGNRESFSAAIAAGVLAIGDAHGGAGEYCMEMIAAGLARTREQSISIQEAACQVIETARTSGQRVPGLGHRVHSHDPRTKILFGMASEEGIAGEGIEFMQALAAIAGKKIRPLPINVGGALAAVLHDLGLPPLFGKLVFIVGRVAGLAAEVSEEYEREKPMRIRIPVKYDGVQSREAGSSE